MVSHMDEQAKIDHLHSKSTSSQCMLETPDPLFTQQRSKGAQTIMLPIYCA